MPSLSSAHISFAWKLVHGLLPTEEKVSRTLGRLPPNCRQSCIGSIVSDLEHVFFWCDCSRTVGPWLLSLLRNYIPDILPKNILELSFDAGCDSLVWISVQILQYIWNKRTSNKAASLLDCFSILHDNATLLMGTKHENIPIRIIPLLSL